MQSKVPVGMRPTVTKSGAVYIVAYKAFNVAVFPFPSQAKTFAKAFGKLIALYGSAAVMSLSGLTAAAAQSLSESAINAKYLPNANVGP